MDTSPRAATRFQRDGSTVRIDDGLARVSLTFCTPRIVRVELLGSAPDPGPSFVVPRDWPATPITVHDGEPARLETSDLGVEVTTSPVRLAFLDTAGNWLLREPADAGMEREPGASGRERVHARFAFSGEQHFYGLGQGGGPLDRLGTYRQLWNTHLGHGPGSDMAVPLLVSNRGYAMFFDNSSDARLAVGRSDSGVRITYAAESGRLCFVLPDRPGSPGRDAARSPSSWAGRRCPRAGRSASSSRAGTSATRPSSASCRARIREKRIPCDGLIYLSTYGEANGWNRGVGHLEFQPELCSDPAGILEGGAGPALRDHDPRVPGAPRGLAALRRGGVAGLPPGGRLRARQRERPAPGHLPRGPALPRLLAAGGAAGGGGPPTGPLVRLGVAGWWLDGGEGPPASATLHAGDGALLHNIYDRFRHQAFAEGEAADRPDQRVFLLCRSGAAGMQRFGATCWSGDINNDFADARGPGPARAEHGALRRAVLGHRRRRLLPSDRGDRRALRALVPARRLQPDLPLARLGLAGARAVGPRPRGGGDLPARTPSCAIGCSPTPTRWPGRRTRSACR